MGVQLDIEEFIAQCEGKVYSRTPVKPKESDELILLRLKNTVVKERQELISILKDIIEVEQRDLFALRGFSSLFQFLRFELLYSEAEASLRSGSARLLYQAPGIEAHLLSGKLTLTQSYMVYSYVKKESKRTKSRIETEKVMELVSLVLGLSSRATQQKLSGVFPGVELQFKELTRVLDQEHTLLQFVADTEMMESLEEFKNLTSHKNFERRHDLAFKMALQIAVKEIDPLRPRKKRGVRVTSDVGTGVESKLHSESEAESKSSAGSEAMFDSAPVSDTAPVSGAVESFGSEIETRATSEIGESSETRAKTETNSTYKPLPSEPTPPTWAQKYRSRYIPKSVKRAVLSKNQSCEYTDPLTGRRCNSKHGIQLDHRTEFALGGEHSVENVRVLCGVHNRLIYGQRIEVRMGFGVY